MSYTYRFDEKAGMDIIEHSGNKSGISVRRLGGELISYRAYDPKQARLIPFMYRDSLWEADDKFWKNHATILFPMVGGLKGKQSLYRESIKISSKGNHGFARHSVFTLKDKNLADSSASLHYILEPNDETKGYYPFQFRLELIYMISGNNLTLEFITTNIEKDRVLPFSIGWHPGFKTPVLDKGKKTDCQLRLPHGSYLHYKCNEESRLTGQTETITLTGAFPFTENMLAGTVMLYVEKKQNRHVTLFDPASKIGLKMDFSDFPYLGFWANAGENYICIEPWQGLDDHEEQEPFEKKVGLVELKPGQKDKRKVTVTPEL